MALGAFSGVSRSSAPSTMSLRVTLFTVAYATCMRFGNTTGASVWLARRQFAHVYRDGGKFLQYAIRLHTTRSPPDDASVGIRCVSGIADGLESPLLFTEAKCPEM